MSSGSPCPSGGAHPRLFPISPLVRFLSRLSHPLLSLLLDVAIRTSVVYLALLVGLRLTGKRQLGQMSTFDFVLLLIIANAVQNAMVGPDTSLAGGLTAAAVLLFWHQVIDRLRRSSRHVGRLLGGTADLLIYRGRVLHHHLARENLTTDELRQALREHGVGA